MSNCPILTNSEMLRLISNANINALNMKLIDLPEFVNQKSFLQSGKGDLLVRQLFDQNMKRVFCGLELLNGYSIADV